MHPLSRSFSRKSIRFISIMGQGGRSGIITGRRGHSGHLPLGLCNSALLPQSKENLGLFLFGLLVCD